jgi:hypothetical protein
MSIIIPLDILTIQSLEKFIIFFWMEKVNIKFVLSLSALVKDIPLSKTVHTLTQAITK